MHPTYPPQLETRCDLFEYLHQNHVLYHILNIARTRTFQYIHSDGDESYKCTFVISLTLIDSFVVIVITVLKSFISVTFIIKHLLEIAVDFNKHSNILASYIALMLCKENRKSEANYFHSYFTKHRGNMKMLWSGIKSIVCPKKSGFYHVSSLKDSQGNDINDPKKIANLFDKFFVHVSQTINDEIPRTPKSPLDYLRHYIERSFFISPSSATEIEILINSFKMGKSVGPCSIPIKLLKILCSYISHPSALEFFPIN